MTLYVDTSVLVGRYQKQAGFIETNEALTSASTLVTAEITRVEVAATLHRASRNAPTSCADLHRMYSDFEADLEYFHLVLIDRDLISSACDLARKQFLKGYDTVHLAAALTWKLGVEGQVVLATFDKQLWQAAKNEGFEVWPEDLGTFLEDRKRDKTGPAAG